jgi:hypothetical protein
MIQSNSTKYVPPDVLLTFVAMALSWFREFTKTLTSCFENYFWKSCCISVTRHIICLLSLYIIPPSVFCQSTTESSEVTVPVAVFGVTECVVIEHNNPLLLVSITLHVLVLLTDHHQVYMFKQQVCMQVEYCINLRAHRCHNLTFM